jgi:hypothetical protein
VATKTESKQRTIEIPEIQLSRLTVTIEGVTPLIVHRFGERSRQAIEDKQQKAARTARPARDPKAEFQDSLYPLAANGDGQERYGFPAAGVKKALVTAGGRFADEHMTVLRGVLNILSDLLEIRGSEPIMRSDMVRIDGGRTCTIAYRPQFMPWELEVPIIFNATMLSESQVLNLVQIAGFAVGIGDWRPERNGTFGQFAIKGVEAS